MHSETTAVDYTEVKNDVNVKLPDIIMLSRDYMEVE